MPESPFPDPKALPLTEDPVLIRAADITDAAQLCSLYNHYVTDTTITFEEAPVSIPAFADRIRDISAAYPWLVMETAGRIAGYAYGAPWKSRSAYRFSAETTIYLAPEARGQGLGLQLYRELINRLRERGLRSLVGGIALPNPASIALHEKLGFEKIGQFRQIGHKFGDWIDVGYWQLLLESQGQSGADDS